MLTRTRREAEAHRSVKPAGAESERELLKALDRAEGSDWFWWFGEGHSSSNDAEFDRLFRAHLSHVYELMKLPPPEDLAQPLGRYDLGGRLVMPTGFIHPKISGRRDDYFAWSCAGRYEAPEGSMHRSDAQIRRVWFGFNAEYFFLRIDTRSRAEDWLNRGGGVQIAFQQPKGFAILIRPDSGQFKAFPNGGNGNTGAAPITVIQAAARQVLMVSIPRRWLAEHAGADRPGFSLAFFVAYHEGGRVMERVPSSGALMAPVPSDDFEMENWRV